jgi:hypothetical protein
MNEDEAARRFMEEHLGPDWELLLMEADAYPVYAPVDEMNASERRAVELVCEVDENCPPAMREAAAYAWRVLAEQN